MVYHTWSEEEGSVDIFSFTIKEWCVDEAFLFEEGDRGLLQEKAYIRKNDAECYLGRSDEMNITLSSHMRIGRAKKTNKSGINSGLIPQKSNLSYAWMFFYGRRLI